MACYSFKCNSCEWEGDRICRWDDISNQTCENVITKKKGPADITGWQPGDPQIEEYSGVCGGELVRSEEIEIAGITPKMWKYGTAG